MKVHFYTKENCLLCEEAYTLLQLFQNEYEFDVEIRDIYTNDEWLEEFQVIIPVIQVDQAYLTVNDMNYEKLAEFFRNIHKND